MGQRPGEFYDLKSSLKVGGTWFWRAHFVAWRFTRVTLLFSVFTKQFSRKFIKILKVTPSRACPKTFDSTLFLVLLKHDILWNWAIRVGWLVSTFRCWQFSPSSFFARKNTTEKLIFLCSLLTDVNSSQKEINVPFLSKKESHFDLCTCRGFQFLHFSFVFLKLVFSRYHM